MDALAAWLERYSPSTRIFIVAGVTALLVFFLEEMTRPSSHPAPIIVKEDETPLKHVFNNLDVSSVTDVATSSSTLLKSLDQEMSKPHANPNTIICLNGLHYGVYGYINAILLRLQQDVTTSVHMQKAEDEAYVNSSIMDTVGTTLTVLPAMDNTITVMTQGCPGDGTVSTWGSQIKGVLQRTGPVLHKLQTEGRLSQTKLQE